MFFGFQYYEKKENRKNGYDVYSKEQVSYIQNKKYYECKEF